MKVIKAVIKNSAVTTGTSRQAEYMARPPPTARWTKTKINFVSRPNLFDINKNKIFARG
jgi:hypothetical protein